MPTRAPWRRVASVSPLAEIKAIASVFAAANRGKAQARGHVGGNVFDAVHGEIDLFVEQSFFQFLDENAFAADLRERTLAAICRRWS